MRVGPLPGTGARCQQYTLLLCIRTSWGPCAPRYLQATSSHMHLVVVVLFLVLQQASAILSCRHQAAQLLCRRLAAAATEGRVERAHSPHLMKICRTGSGACAAPCVAQLSRGWCRLMDGIALICLQQTCFLTYLACRVQCLLLGKC